jgi:hypothetical protein
MITGSPAAEVFGLSEQVPGVFQVDCRLGYAAAASGIGWLKQA